MCVFVVFFHQNIIRFNYWIQNSAGKKKVVNAKMKDISMSWIKVVSKGIAQFGQREIHCQIYASINIRSNWLFGLEILFWPIETKFFCQWENCPDGVGVMMVVVLCFFWWWPLFDVRYGYTNTENNPWVVWNNAMFTANFCFAVWKNQLIKWIWNAWELIHFCPSSKYFAIFLLFSKAFWVFLF